MATVDDLLAAQSALHYGGANKLRAKNNLPALNPVTQQIIQGMIQQGFDWSHFTPKGFKQPKQAAVKKAATALTQPQSQLEKAAADLATSKAKAAGIKTKSPGRHWWDDWAENVTGAGSNALGKLATAANYTVAPLGRGVEAGLDEFSQKMADITGGQSIENSRSRYKNKNILDAILHRTAGGFLDRPKDVTSGSEIVANLPEVKGMSGGWQKSALTTGAGLATDIATDPLTYVTLGTTSLGQKAGLKSLEKTGAVEKGVKSALKDIEEGTVARSARKMTAGEIENRTAQAVAKRAELPALKKAAEKNLIKQGADSTASNFNKLVQDEIAQHLKPFEDQVRQALTESNKRRLAFKIAGKDVLEGTKVGEKIGRAAYLPGQVLGKGAMAVAPVKALKHSFQIGEHFPGLANRYRRVMEGRGVVQFEAASKNIDNMVKGLTHNEERTILRDLEHNIRTTGTSKSGEDLSKVWDAFDARRKQMFQTQADLGIYQPQHQSNHFVPHYYREGSNEAIQAFKKERKDMLRLAKVPTGTFIKDAAEKGLKPLDMVSDAFKHGEADVSRKVARAGYDTMLINEYGAKAAAGADDLMKARNMVDVTSKLSPELQKKFAEDGQKMWLHKEMARSMDTFHDFAKMGRNEDLNRFMRAVNKTTNAWKSSATVYNPGNWVNNTLGDQMLNFMEGVNPGKWQPEAMRLLREAPNGTVKIGGHEIDRTTLKHLYEQYAAGGFLHPDIPSEFLRKTADNPLVRGGMAANKGIKTAYQHREDFSRMAHFLHALDDEMSRLPSSAKSIKGMKLGDRLEKAAAKAGDRVAKWNIDYSSFTPFERNLKKFIPFYSWQRKSVPLMIEAMATKPGRVAAVQRTKSAIDQMLGGKGDQPGTNYPVAIPMWLRDAGYMRVSNGAEPWTIRDPLPTNVMGNTFGGGGSGVLLNQVAGLHPGIRMLLEQAFQKEAFTGRQPPGGMEYALNQLPFSSTLSSALGTDIRSGAKLNAGERIGQLLGSKPYQITEARQAGELRRQAQPFKTQVAQINKQLKEKGIAMRKKKDGSTEVYNPATKVVLGKYGNPTDAMMAAIKAAGL